jgi:hypothetical protein
MLDWVTGGAAGAADESLPAQAARRSSKLPIPIDTSVLVRTALQRSMGGLLPL